MDLNFPSFYNNAGESDESRSEWWATFGGRSYLKEKILMFCGPGKLSLFETLVENGGTALEIFGQRAGG